MRLPYVLLLATTGCAQLAGIDETSSGTPSNSTLSVERVSIGVTVERAPLDLTGLTATYLIEDPAGEGGFRRVPATVDGTTWTADLDGVIAPVLFELPVLDDPMGRKVLRLFDIPSAEIRTSLVTWERAATEEPPVDAMLNVTVNVETPWVDGDTLQLHTLGGTWARRSLDVPVAGAGSVGPTPYAYATLSSLTGRSLKKLGMQDLVFAVRRNGNAVTGYAEAMSFEQAQTTDLTFTMMPVNAGENALTLNLQHMAAVTRFAAARPAVGTPGFTWEVRVGPAPTHSPNLLVNGGGVPADMPQLVASYGNPFAARGWTPTVSVIGSATRSYTSTNGLTATLSARLFDVAVAMPEQALGFEAGLPERISINKTSLSTDNVMIPFPIAPVEIEIETDRSNNTLYQATLVELVPNADNTAFTQREIVSAYGIEPRFLLPPELFLAGRFYVVRAHAYVGGFPNAAQGDLVDRSLPFSAGVVDSGVFGVM